MGSEYTAIASMYDSFRGESPNMWAAYIDELFSIYAEKKPNSVIDLCCGTGTVTAAMCRLGYNMTGVDVSEDMLALAQKNAPDAFLVHQDMRSLQLYNKYDACISCLDSINYLPCEDDVIRTFSAVGRYLSDGGLFIFDVNTESRFKNKYGNNDFILENKNGLIAWSCEYHPRLKRCDFYLSCFTLDPDGRYSRKDEEQSEYCYSDRFLKEAAKAAGFEVLASLGRMSLSAPKDDEEKIHYILRKI